jgi:hypothetical protein
MNGMVVVSTPPEVNGDNSESGQARTRRPQLRDA